jgi:hypothetical protein
MLPLLEDAREAAALEVPSAPGVTRPTVRVQDLAAFSIAYVLDIKLLEYKLNDNPRHEQMELDKLRMLAINALLANKDP